MSVSEDTAQVIADLRSARAELERRGRCTGTPLGFSGGTVCAVGAAIAGVAPELLSHETRTYDVAEIPRALAVVMELHRHLPDEYIEDNDPYGVRRYFDVSAFNDARRTTDQDVLNLFDKALAELGGLGDE